MNICIYSLLHLICTTLIIYSKIIYNYIYSVNVQILYAIMFFIYYAICASYTSISILISLELVGSALHNPHSKICFGPAELQEQTSNRWTYTVQDAAPEIITIIFQCNYINSLIQYVYYFHRYIVVKSFKLLSFGHFRNIVYNKRIEC